MKEIVEHTESYATGLCSRIGTVIFRPDMFMYDDRYIHHPDLFVEESLEEGLCQYRQ